MKEMLIRVVVVQMRRRAGCMDKMIKEIIILVIPMLQSLVITVFHQFGMVSQVLHECQCHLGGISFKLGRCAFHENGSIAGPANYGINNCHSILLVQCFTVLCNS
jgi:hypothetical protein